ncbi:MAG: di/tricarboxylate transporter [Porticoccus sp.]|jgi:di/tricarboxylate transporter
MHLNRLHQITHHFRQAALLAGPLLAIIVYCLVSEQAAGLNGAEIALGAAGRATAGLAVWMAVWWLAEATSIYATALLPLAIILPATIASSCAFMLPVATPPNAIVFSSNLIRIPEMAKAGFWLNLTGILLISLMTQVTLTYIL